MRQSTPAQQAAARANGARSRGPATPEGKLRSSENSLRHGLLARTAVLANESHDGFEEMLQGHIRRIGPRDSVEHEAIEEMCSAAWRLRRLWCMERKALDLELAAQDSPDQLERTVNAFDSLARILKLRQLEIPNEPEDSPRPPPPPATVRRVPRPARDAPSRRQASLQTGLRTTQPQGTTSLFSRPKDSKSGCLTTARIS